MTKKAAKKDNKGKKMKNKLDFLKRNRTNAIIAAAVALAVGISGYMLIATRASGFFASTEPENATLSGNASTINDSSASNGKAISFNAPVVTPPTGGGGGGGGSTGGGTVGGVTPCPAFPAFPDKNCTGYFNTDAVMHNCDNAGTTFDNAIWLETDNAVYDGCSFTKSVMINASHITIKRSHIHGVVRNHDYDFKGSPEMNGLVISDTEIEWCHPNVQQGPNIINGCTLPSTDLDHSFAAVSGNNFTLIRCNIHNTDTGVHLGDNSKIIDSYLHDFDYADGDHGASVGMGQGYGIGSQIIHNNLQSNRLAGQPKIFSSALSLYSEPDVSQHRPELSNVLIQNNLFNLDTADEGYCVLITDGTTDIRVISNRWGKMYHSNCGGFGPSAASTTGAGSIWTDNAWQDGSGAVQPKNN